ncbi:MAG: helical backbone metal receptor [Planctomycetota bacterium]
MRPSEQSRSRSAWLAGGVAILLVGVLAIWMEVWVRPTSAALERENEGIVSLSPALTSMVIGLGNAPMLVGVSNYDTASVVDDVPRVGDLSNVDWEELAELRPAVILVQSADDAFVIQAQAFGAEVEVLPIDKLDDIDRAVGRVMARTEAEGVANVGAWDGQASGDRFIEWNKRLSEMRRVEHEKLVPTLLVCGDRSLCAGRGTYLDELLTLAGGVNVLAGEGYLEPDDERVAVLAPEVILVLLPEGDAAAVRGRWERFGARVEIIERADALVPGWNVVEIGEAMRAVLVERRPEGALRGSGRTDPRLRGLSLRLQGYGLRLQGVTS